MIQRVLQRAERELRRFNQDRRNARMIGELAVRQLRNRLSTTPIASEPVQGEVLASERRLPSSDSSPDRWALLSAQELIDQLEGMGRGELLEVLRREQEGRNRISVVEAIRARLSDGAT
jgi:hypothetical protein